MLEVKPFELYAVVYFKLKVNEISEGNQSVNILPFQEKHWISTGP